MKRKCIVKHYSGMTITSRADDVTQEVLDKTIKSLEGSPDTLILFDEEDNIHVIKKDFLSNSVITFQKCED